MTEKNIFVYKPFFVIKYFIFLCTFYVKTAPPKKVTALFTRNHSLKIEILSSPLLFWKFCNRLDSTNPAERGVHTMMTLPLLCLIVGESNCKFWEKSLSRSLIIPPWCILFTPLPPNNQAQKNRRFWPLRGLGLGKSVKKGKFVIKIFFRSC